MRGPFARMAYADAMERYGCDRPDLRYGLEIRDYSDAFRDTEFSIARSVLNAGGRINFDSPLNGSVCFAVYDD